VPNVRTTRQRLEAIQRRLDQDTAWLEKTYPGIEKGLGTDPLTEMWRGMAAAAEFCSQVLAQSDDAFKAGR
jgi:hypothetical protein